jgi:hypothetical protein
MSLLYTQPWATSRPDRLNEHTTPATALTSPPLDNWGALHELEAALTRLKVVELYAEEYSTDVRGSVEERNYTTKLLNLRSVFIISYGLPSDFHLIRQHCMTTSSARLATTLPL